MLTQEDKDEMRRLRDEDPKKWTYAAIGKKFGVTHQRVVVLLNEKSYEIHRRYNRDYKRRLREGRRSIQGQD